MVQIHFSPEANEIYEFLKVRSPISKKERMILDSLQKKLDIIRYDPHYGDPVKKRLIPAYYKIKYSANNLFRVELPQFWRMLYTITDDEDEIEIIALILDVCDHKEYNRKFGYK